MERKKYPRTHNLPWSGSDSSDDVWWKDCKPFEGKEVVVSEKIDGESTSIYPDAKTHARSVDSKHHPSRSWLKQFAATFAYKIPEGHRICGENVVALHSIFYTNLPSHFLVYGIYDNDICLSWSDTEYLCKELELQTVPILYKGIWNQKKIVDMWTGKGTYPTFELKDTVYLNQRSKQYPDDFEPCVAEGYVVRLAESFKYSDFSKSCAKYVRPRHVKTSQHWMENQVIQNLLSDA